MEPRLNVLELIVGQKGCGKTNYTLEVNKNDKRVIYVMQLDHPKFRQYRNVNTPELWNEGKVLRSWKTGHIRIVGTNTEEIFEAINRYVKNAKICYEDATQYIPYQLPRSVLSTLINSKQNNNDLQLQFHSLRRIPMDLYDNADYLTLFKTRDQVNNIGKIPGYLKELHKKVSAHPFKHHHVTIELN